MPSLAATSAAASASAGACRFSISSSGCSATCRSARAVRSSHPTPRNPRCAPQPNDSMYRSVVAAAAALFLFALTSCETLRHQFVSPEPDWQSQIGQLQYRGPRISLIGDVLVRYSNQGDFELTFTKGPGVTLLTVRQDDKFVRVSGPLARGSWGGRAGRG